MIWLKCRSAQLQFNIYWAPGQENLADFVSQKITHHKALRPIYLAPDSTDKQLSMQGCIKILQSRLVKPVTLKTHTKLMPVPVTSKPFSYKQIIQTVKQSRPTQVSKPIVQVQQQPPASPTASKTASLFDPLNTSRAPFQIPLQAHHTKWIQAPICRYSKQLQTAI